jgi:hypothetical protein
MLLDLYSGNTLSTPQPVCMTPPNRLRKVIWPTGFIAQVMGRDDTAIAAEQGAADEYFAATFGSLYVRGSLVAFGLDPRVGYTAYFISGEDVPPEGWVVRDGGFRADLTDGTFVVYGDYRIRILPVPAVQQQLQ